MKEKNDEPDLLATVAAIDKMIRSIFLNGTYTQVF